MGANLRTEILTFVKSLPYWQQYLSAFCLDILDCERDEAIEEAYLHFLSEHGLIAPKEKSELIFPAATKDPVATQIEGLKLLAVKNFKNVNAMREGQCLPIAKSGITALGGLNGAGKSSIARLLNSVFYSRGEDEILPNNFEPGDGQPASAVFVFEKPDGTIYEREYIADGNHHFPEFQQFASFDTKCVNIHLNDENELHIAPRGFHFFGLLADLTNRMLDRLTQDIGRIDTVNHFTEQLDGESDTKLIIAGLGAQTDIEKIKSILTFDESDEASIHEIRKEIEELNWKSLETQRKDLTEIKGQLLRLKGRIDSSSEKLSAVNLGAMEHATASLRDLTKAVQEKGAERFQNSGIKGAGSDTWKIFIQSSQTLASLQHDHYPTTGDVCLFCAQNMSGKAIAHVQAYWEFLSSDAETQLRVVKNFINQKNTELAELDLKLPDETSSLVDWFARNAQVEYQSVKTYFEAQSKNREAVQSAFKSAKWVPLTPPTMAHLDGLIQRVDAELKAIDTKSVEEKKLELEKRLSCLNHRKKMAGKLPEIIEWISAQKRLKSLSALKSRLSTRAITETGKRLFDVHVTKKYNQVFQQECTDLNARFKLEMTQKGKGGKSHRKYQIEGYPPGKIRTLGVRKILDLGV